MHARIFCMAFDARFAGQVDGLAGLWEAITRNYYVAVSTCDRVVNCALQLALIT